MASSSGQVRIIAGQWRSRRLAVVNRPGLRPTPDAVRETLFNWLATRVHDAHCLDLFAGSGALGFEAASRGAGSVLMLDQDRQAIAALQRNLEQLQANQVSVRRHDAVRFLQHKGRDGAIAEAHFDIVFIDPPFHKGLLQPSIDALVSGAWLARNAVVYVERAHADPLIEVPGGWIERRHKRSGASDIHLYDCP